MRIYSVAFFGHRYVDNIIKVEDLLEEQIRKLIDENEYVDFLVGRNGDFDQCVSSSVLRVRKNHRDDNSALVLVLPYHNILCHSHYCCFSCDLVYKVFVWHNLSDA